MLHTSGNKDRISTELTVLSCKELSNYPLSPSLLVGEYVASWKEGESIGTHTYIYIYIYVT
jgi:hypothetical protein